MKYKFRMFPICFSLSYFFWEELKLILLHPQVLPLNPFLDFPSGFLNWFYHAYIALSLLASFLLPT